MTLRSKAELINPNNLSDNEQQLKLILNSVRIGIIIVDPTTHIIVDANDTAIEMIGALRDNIIGHTCHHFICPADIGKCPITDLKQSVDDSERIMLRTDGSEIPVLKTVVSTVIDGQTRLIESFIDISERKKNEQELQKAHDELERRVEERTAELEQSRLEMIWRLAKAGEYRDEGTGNHVLRVGYYCRAIAEQLGLEDHITRQIFLTSPLHDIGKIGIPDAVLKKRGPFNIEERAIMEKHCEIGAKILAHPHGDTCSLWICSAFSKDSGSIDNDLIKMAAAIALHHHERWDGKGYPNRLAKDEIPIEAQITAVADVYDALSTNRPYKAAYSHEEAMKMMGAEVGLHFSPTVFAAMEASMERILMIKDEISDQLHDDIYEKAA